MVIRVCARVRETKRKRQARDFLNTLRSALFNVSQSSKLHKRNRLIV